MYHTYCCHVHVRDRLHRYAVTALLTSHSLSHFIRCVDRWEEARNYSGPSPAAMWHSFYEWSLTNSPTHTHSILDTAVNTLADGHHRTHYNTPHCTLLFVHWADYMTAPMDYYADVWQEGIGRELTLFYVSWADCCEREACWDEADGVYMRGLMATAQPLGELIAAYNQFKLRWAEQRRSKGEVAAVRSVAAAENKKRNVSVTASQHGEASGNAAKQAKTAAAAAPHTAPPAGGGDERSAGNFHPHPLDCCYPLVPLTCLLLLYPLCCRAAMCVQ